MSKTVDYYLAPQSPWTYLGHQRFEERRPAGGGFDGGRGKFEGRSQGGFERREQGHGGFEHRHHGGGFEGRQHGGFEARQDKRFEDRRPSGAGHFERREGAGGAPRSPFEKRGHAGAGKSFGGGFDAKKRAPKPRTVR